MKDKSRRKKTRFSRAKILEIKAKTDGIGKLRHKLFAIFDDTREADSGYSLKELSAALYPNEMKRTEDGVEPTLEGKEKTRAAIGRWRKALLNGEAVVVPFAVNTAFDGYLFYNMQNKKQFLGVIKLGEDVIDGIEKLLRQFSLMLEKSKREKEDINDEMRENIRRTLLSLRKSRSKRT